MPSPRTLSLAILLSSALFLHATDWPQFRGRDGSGVVADKVLPPSRWTTTENVAWKTTIPGHGWSGPIVAGDRVFVTSCVSDNKVVSPKTGYYVPTRC